MITGTESLNTYWLHHGDIPIWGISLFNVSNELIKVELGTRYKIGPKSKASTITEHSKPKLSFINQRVKLYKFSGLTFVDSSKPATSSHFYTTFTFVRVQMAVCHEHASKHPQHIVKLNTWFSALTSLKKNKDGQYKNRTLFSAMREDYVNKIWPSFSTLKYFYSQIPIGTRTRTKSVYHSKNLHNIAREIIAPSYLSEFYSLHCESLFRTFTPTRSEKFSEITRNQYQRWWRRNTNI